MSKPRFAPLVGAIALASAHLAGAAPVPVTEQPVSPAAAHAQDAAPAQAAPAVRRDDPFYASLLEAGHFVLDVGTFSAQRAKPAPAVSAAPLPGALWLFGSALLAFMFISGRRKF